VERSTIKGDNMLGTIIVKFMDVVLNLIALIVIILGGSLGAHWGGGFFGAIIGIIIAFFADAVLLGTIFLIFEINNNLVRLNATIEKMSQNPQRGG
jgi:divalent metal cation (Fe/Co/Zn/Cd) transporter